MTPDDLAAIRARDAAYLAHAHYTESYWSAADDRRALLAEVDRLMKEAEEHHLQDIADWQDYNATENEA